MGENCLWCGAFVPADPDTGYQGDFCSERCRDFFDDETSEVWDDPLDEDALLDDEEDE